MKKHQQPLTSATLYTCVSSDRALPCVLPSWIDHRGGYLLPGTTVGH